MFLCVFLVRASDKRIACDEDLSDSEDEDGLGRRDRQNYKPRAKRARNEDEKKENAEKGKDSELLGLIHSFS